MTIVEAAAALQAGTVRSEQLTESALARIAELNPRLNAFITVTADEALAAARKVDQEIAGGRHRGPLHGIPLSIKDLLDMHGHATTAASRLRAEHRADRDATAVARLRHAGAVFVGKTNLHEFALGTTTEESGWGPARNPVDPSRSPGGSSGGSAIAVQTGMSLAAVGTDTGGSVRIPAAACGIVGLKPGWDEIPADGVVPLSRQLDHVGPLAQSVEDASLLYAVMADIPAAPLEALPVAGRRFGLLTAFMDRLDEDVERRVLDAVDALRRAGAIVAEIELAHAAYIASTYIHIVLADGAAYHAATLERRAGAYTANVRHRFEMGRYILAEDYIRALSGRRVMAAEVDGALQDVEALILPALAIPAPPLGADLVPVKGGHEPVRTAMLRCTQLFNLTSHPAISLPCGTTPQGLPVGLQLAGRRGATRDLLLLARAVERLFHDHA